MAKRSVASANISFGLVSIPVKFYLTASADNISFHLMTPAGNRVKMKMVDAVTDVVIEKDLCDKIYEYSKGQYVKFSAEELKKLGDADGGTMEIKEFIPASKIDLLHVEKSYYLDVGKGGDKAYRLLTAALQKKEMMAVAQWSNRGRQHLMIIGVRGEGLVAYQMFYDAEVREFELDCAVTPLRDVEIDMACRLIDQLVVPEFDTTKYKNNYNERVLAAVEAKREGRETTDNVGEAPASATSDIMAMLQASLEATAKAAPKKTAKKTAKSA